MYSEHLIAELVRLVDHHYVTGAELDANLSRPVVQVGKIIGPLVGSRPSDIALTWWASMKGTEVPVGTRGAVHLLADSRTGLGLGNGRGVVESDGERVVIVNRPDPSRYIAAYRLPGVSYGGLL